MSAREEVRLARASHRRRGLTIGLFTVAALGFTGDLAVDLSAPRFAGLAVVKPWGADQMVTETRRSMSRPADWLRSLPKVRAGQRL